MPLSSATTLSALPHTCPNLSTPSLSLGSAANTSCLFVQISEPVSLLPLLFGPNLFSIPSDFFKTGNQILLYFCSKPTRASHKGPCLPTQLTRLPSASQISPSAVPPLCSPSRN